MDTNLLNEFFNNFDFDDDKSREFLETHFPEAFEDEDIDLSDGRTGLDSVFSQVCDYYRHAESHPEDEQETYELMTKLRCNICGSTDKWVPIMHTIDGMQQIVAYGCEHEDERVKESLPIRKICTVSATINPANLLPYGTYKLDFIDPKQARSELNVPE